MKNIKRSSLTIASLAFVFALTPISAFAHEEDARTTTITEARCTVAKARLNARLTTIETLKDKSSETFDSISERVDTFLTKATAAGYTEVDQLTAARDSVKTAIDTYKAQLSVYITALQTAQSATCGENGTFAEQLSTARAELKTLRADNQAVKSAVKETAIPALKDYASWLKTNSTNSPTKQGEL